MTYHTPGLLKDMDRHSAQKFADMLEMWRADIPVICRPALPPRGPKPEEFGRFTEFEDELLRKHWGQHRPKIIAAILRRPINSIYGRAGRLGLTGKV